MKDKMEQKFVDFSMHEIKAGKDDEIGRASCRERV